MQADCAPARAARPELLAMCWLQPEEGECPDAAAPALAAVSEGTQNADEIPCVYNGIDCPCVLNFELTL